MSPLLPHGVRDFAESHALDLDTACVWAIEVNLDPEADAQVRSIWRSLDARGVQSLGSVPGTEYRPHLSLAVFKDLSDATAVSDALAPALSTCQGMPLSLASLGFFVGPESVAFLGVTPTERLLTMHRQVHHVLHGLTTDSWQLYEPEKFVPHCTLAMGVDDAASVHAALGHAALPIAATATEVHLVDIANGRSQARLA